MACATTMHTTNPRARDEACSGHDARHPRASPGSRDAASPVLDSQTLLQGLGSVAIRHHGVVYRLQTTRLGKLILTK